MKKNIFMLVLALTIFTACENEWMEDITEPLYEEEENARKEEDPGHQAAWVPVTVCPDTDVFHNRARPPKFSPGVSPAAFPTIGPKGLHGEKEALMGKTRRVTR
jgi:hypothetical protein